MAEERSRRVKRLREKNPKISESELKEKSTDLAIKEVDKFKQENSRWPDPKELEAMSENVYEQLKFEMEKPQSTEQKTPAQEKTVKKFSEINPEKSDQPASFLERRREKREFERQEAARRKQNETGKKQKVPSEIKNEKTGTKNNKNAPAKKASSTKELFGDELKEEMLAEDKDLGDFKKLVGLEELSSLEENLDEKSDVDLIDKDTETDNNSCPNCNNKTKGIIYCPGCGNAFFNHCAKKIEPMADSIKYTCTHCSFEFKKRTHS